MSLGMMSSRFASHTSRRSLLRAEADSYVLCATQFVNLLACRWSRTWCSFCLPSPWEWTHSGIVSRGSSGVSQHGSCEAGVSGILCLRSPGAIEPLRTPPPSPSLQGDPGTCTVFTSLAIPKDGRVQEPFVYTRESLVCMCRKFTHLLRVQRPTVRLCPAPGLREAWTSSPLSRPPATLTCSPGETFSARLSFIEA